VRPARTEPTPNSFVVAFIRRYPAVIRPYPSQIAVVVAVVVAVHPVNPVHPV
jgi:hypothetical protein